MGGHEVTQPDGHQTTEAGGPARPEPPRTKDVDITVRIDASPEDVWKAISTGDGLANWFPLEAEVVPGVDGSVTISWGPDVRGSGRIDAWEENHRLRYVEGEAGADPGAALVAVEFTLEGRGGTTELRLVHSGFSADDDWADFFDTVDSGWRYFLLNLKHYLEQHPDASRRMVWDRRKISVPKPEAWDLLFGGGGLVGIEAAEAGAPGVLWSGDPVVVEMANPPIHLACRCEGLNDALLLVELEPGGDTYSLGVWLSLYGVDEARAEALEASLRERLEQLM